MRRKWRPGKYDPDPRRTGPHVICVRCDYIVEEMPCWGCGEVDGLRRCMGKTPGYPETWLGCVACDGLEYPKPKEEEK